MADIDRRDHPRIEMPGIASVVVPPSHDRFEMAIRDLSTGGARLVGKLSVAIGQRIQLHVELDHQLLTIAADVVRLDSQNAQIAVAFRDLPRSSVELIERSIAALIEQVASTSPTVIVMRAPPETGTALARDLARLGRSGRACSTVLEAIWLLHEPTLRVEAVVIAGDLPEEPLGQLLAYLAEHQPHVRRILVFGDKLTAVDHASSSLVEAMLRTPLRLRSLARTLGIEAIDGSRAMLPRDG